MTEIVCTAKGESVSLARKLLKVFFFLLLVWHMQYQTDKSYCWNDMNLYSGLFYIFFGPNSLHFSRWQRARFADLARSHSRCHRTKDICIFPGEKKFTPTIACRLYAQQNFFPTSGVYAYNVGGFIALAVIDGCFFSLSLIYKDYLNQG